MTQEYEGIKIDLSRDALFDQIGIQRLKDSYLKEGETSPQERFAYVSKMFSSNREHAQRLYDYASNFWFGYSTPILSFGRNKSGLPISCFTGDTWISVKSVGAKQLKDVVVGDEVLTHEGRWKKVIGTKKSISDDLYELQVKGRTTKLKVTGNHLLLTNFGWMPVGYCNKANTLIATNCHYEDISKPYKINIDTTNNNNDIKNRIIVNNDVAWALGLWVSKGECLHDKISVTIPHDNEKHVVRWKDIIADNFGITQYEVRQLKPRTKIHWTSIDITNDVFKKWIISEFGAEHEYKKIPQWALELPIEQLYNFYEGFSFGMQFMSDTEQFPNVNVISQLYHILLKMGRYDVNFEIRPVFNIEMESFIGGVIIENNNLSTIKDDFNIDRGVQFGKHIYRNIQSLVKIEGEYEVYDIQVEDDESFTVSGIIAHNCYLNHVTDTKKGLVDNLSETNWLSMLGGGVGTYWNIRGVDEKSVGVIPHMKVYDDSSLAYKQGTTRRGSYAMYLDISHPDIIEFLEMRKETGDQRRKCLNLHNAVNIPDSFMRIIEQCMIDKDFDDSWELKDPATGKVHEVVSAKMLWQKILELRAGIGRGEPYLHFVDNTNNAIATELKEQGYKVVQSNLCSEILLATDEFKTAVCCLSSLNLEKWDEYKDNYLFFKDIMQMLDNVLTYFIENAPSEISRAVLSAVEERSVGLGVLGFHSYLQKKNIPFEGVMAKVQNNNIFKTIRKMIDLANLDLGAERGSPKMLTGTGKRFAFTQAIAPTATNALICGNVSPSIEPWRANAFRQDTLSGTFIQKNKALDALLKKKAADKILDYDETWAKIVQDEGSVQNIEQLTELEKAVFKTASEIDMMWAVEHVADRQQYVDQGQSFNIFIRPDISIAKLHAIHFAAWRKGVKTMYYCRSEKLANTEKVSQRIERKRIEDDVDLQAILDDSECLACHS